MARTATAQEQLFALRQQIARIEGTQPERLEGGRAGGEEVEKADDSAGMLVRRNHPAGLFPLGVVELDEALGGGLPRAALIEIIGRQTRDAAVAAGFSLALAAIARKGSGSQSPLLWIGLSNFFFETGLPYAPGFTRLFGITPDRLLLVHPKRIEDALWVAEEAAIQNQFGAILLELQGNPAKLTLTATRRLSHRARAAGYPLFLIRHAGEEEPTAASTRFQVSSAASTLRETIAGTVPRSIGPPAFAVTLTRSRTGKEGTFVLEWNSHDLTFQERQPVRGKPLQLDTIHAADTGNLAAPSGNGSHSAPPARSSLAAGRQKAG